MHSSEFLVSWGYPLIGYVSSSFRCIIPRYVLHVLLSSSSLDDRWARNLKLVDLYCLSLTKAPQSNVIPLVAYSKFIELNTTTKSLILFLCDVMTCFMIIKYPNQKGTVCPHLPYWLRARNVHSQWTLVTGALSEISRAIDSSRVNCDL